MASKSPANQNKPSARRKRIRVGDTGTLDLGYGKIRVRVIEDRGCIGKNGRRLLRVQHTQRGYDSDSFEVPEEEFSTK